MPQASQTPAYASLPPHGPHRAAIRRRPAVCPLVITVLGCLLTVPGPGSRVLAQEGESPAKQAAAGTSAKWKPLFDGKTLAGWKSTNFGGEGEVHVEKGKIVLEMGSSLTGITYKGDVPKCDYELRLEAARLDGVDFFCALTFPVQESHCSFVVGGWAGAVVGISSIDGRDASENETTQYLKFDTGKWYRIRVQVTKDHLRAWIDDKQLVDVKTQGRKLDTRPEVDLSKPLGIASWETRAALRKIQIRRLKADRK